MIISLWLAELVETKGVRFGIPLILKLRIDILAIKT
jgi:hypothetical protein